MRTSRIRDYAVRVYNIKHDPKYTEEQWINRLDMYADDWTQYQRDCQEEGYA